MSKKKQRQLIIMLIALLIAVLLLVVGIVANKMVAKHKEVAEDAATPRIVQMEAVNKITLTNESGEVTLQKDAEGAWQWAEDSGFPLDDTTCTDIYDLVEDFKAEQELDIVDSLEAYGLQDTAYRLTVSNESGESATVLLGTTTGELYYAMLDGQDKIYTVDSELSNQLNKTLNDMAKSADYPALAADIIQDVTIEGQTHKESFTVQPVEVEKESTDTEGDTSASTSAEPELTTEYHFFRNGVDLNGDSIATLFRTELDTISTEALAYYRPTDAERKACGLTAPVMTVTVHYTLDGESKALTFTIGATDENGDYYCELSTMPNCIYTISADSVGDLLNVATMGYDGAKKAVDAED